MASAAAVTADVDSVTIPHYIMVREPRNGKSGHATH